MATQYSVFDASGQVVTNKSFDTRGSAVAWRKRLVSLNEEEYSGSLHAGIVCPNHDELEQGHGIVNDCRIFPGCEMQVKPLPHTEALRAAKLHLKPFGATIAETVNSCKHSREYRVNAVNGTEETAYYTSDLTDAICTGEVINLSPACDPANHPDNFTGQLLACDHCQLYASHDTGCPNAPRVSRVATEYAPSLSWTSVTV